MNGEGVIDFLRQIISGRDQLAVNWLLIHKRN
jgi:hypothetical protein